MSRLPFVIKVFIFLIVIAIFSSIRTIVDVAIGIDFSHYSFWTRITHVVTYLMSGGIEALIVLELMGFIKRPEEIKRDLNGNQNTAS